MNLYEVDGKTIKYHPQYFTKTHIHSIVHGHIVEIDEENVNTDFQANSVLTMEQAMDIAWVEINKSGSYRRDISKHNYSKEKAISHLKSGLSKAITQADDQELSKSMSFTYETLEESEGYSHRYNDELILYVPKDMSNSKEISDKVNFLMYLTFVLIDICAIILRAVGINCHLKRDRLLRDVRNQNLWQRFINMINGENRRLAQMIEDIKNTENRIKKVLHAISYFYSNFSLKNFFKALFDEMTFFQKLKAALSLVASIVLFIATEGTSLMAKIVALVAAVTQFLLDTERMVTYGKKVL